MTVDDPGTGVFATGEIDPSAPGFLGVDVHRTDPGTVVCRLAGDLDLGSLAPVRAALDGALESGTGLLVVDLAGVDFCDSSGLNLLLQVRIEAEAAGVRLRLAALTSQVARVFELTGALEVFSVHADAEEAQRA
ncbi:MAG TPA: STAS domain-containing protein [Actinocrinis sp.]|nr:STAS domain-containing protein [Actinocrinis sp.]